jgi:Arc/MetJ-type ribon-helix-helix transcriptional regulator
MTTKERGIYQGISLPLSLIQEIKKHIEKRRQYKGVTEFVREAIREKMTTEKSMPSDLNSANLLDYLKKSNLKARNDLERDTKVRMDKLDKKLDIVMKLLEK